VHYATGKLKSKGIADIVNRLRQNVSAGDRLISIRGEDTGCYGLNTGTNICELLEKVCEVPGDYKIILHDFNPQWILRYYLRLKEILSCNIDRFDRITVPLQSGSQRVLEAMNRPYPIDEVTKCLLDYRRTLPTIKLKSHFIIGFPTETDGEFEITKALVTLIRPNLASLHVYADRKNTPAYIMPQKIDWETKLRRASELENVCRTVGCSYNTLGI